MIGIQSGGVAANPAVEKEERVRPEVLLDESLTLMHARGKVLR